MSLSLITPPAIEPLTLADAKAHLKVDVTDDDALITRLITAARARAEWHTARGFITQTWRLWLDCWPSSPVYGGGGPRSGGGGDGIIEIPLPPLQSVASVTTYALDDSATVLDPATYQADSASAPARLTLKATVSPPINMRAMNAVAVEFTAGYGDDASDVPAPIVEAILEIVAFLYENRGEAPAELPFDVLALLAPYRLINF